MSCLKCILFPFLILSLSLSSQQNCASIHQQLPKIYETSQLRSDEVIIPVVIHIVYTTDQENISDVIISEQLDFVNQFLNGENPDLQHANAEIKPTIGRPGFKLRLAEIDPFGEVTNGIVRIQTETEKIGDQISSQGISLIKTAAGGSPPWDPESYLNIWVGHRTLSLGYTITNTSESTDIQGIVIDIQEFKSQGKTIIHELGHYLGLLHPWGNRTGCDGEEDDIADTPFQAYPNFECELYSECSETIIPGNVMDFSPDQCLLFFTKLQSESMQQFILQYKSELIESEDCFFNNLPQSSEISVSLTEAAIEIYLGAFELEAFINLYTINGQLVRTISIKGDNYLKYHTAGIPTGIYVLTLVSDDIKMSRKVFIY